MNVALSLVTYCVTATRILTRQPLLARPSGPTMKLAHQFLLTTVLISPAFAAPLLDVNAIVGKTPKEVKAVLGAPESSDATKSGLKQVFKKGGVEIVFFKGKADWITFTPGDPVAFSKDAIAKLGLTVSAPTFSNPSVIRWEPCGKLVSVSVFPASSSVDYFYVRAFTK